MNPDESRRRPWDRTAPGSTADLACRRRWVAVPLAAALLVGGSYAGLADARPPLVLTVAAAALLLNAGLQLVARGRRFAGAVLPASALSDLVLVTVAVAFAGHQGVALLYLPALAPYVISRSGPAGRWMPAAAGVLAVAAQYLHARCFEPRAVIATPLDLPASAYVSGAFLWAVALALFRAPASLAKRLRAMRLIMEEAAQGDLAVRASGAAGDELGILEQSFNRMMDVTAATISTVQREADEVAAYAETLAAFTDALGRTSASVGESAARLAAQLREQRLIATTSSERTGRTTAEAAALRERAGRMAERARALLVAAEASRERIGHAGTALVAVGDEVRRGAGAVSAVAPVSERIGELANTLSGLARQTNLLGLNVAIEAARAEEHGQGFAVVAREVRKLAEESARAARDVRGAIADVRDGVATAVAAIRAAEGKVRDTGDIAEEADLALREVLGGIASLSALVAELAPFSQQQAEAMASLQDAMGRIEALAAGSADAAAQAAGAVTEQQVALQRIAETSRQLADVAERLRGSIVSFSVLGRRHDTAEYAAIRDS